MVLVLDWFFVYCVVECGLVDFYFCGVVEIIEEMVVVNVLQLMIVFNFVLCYLVFFILYVKKGNFVLVECLIVGFECMLQFGEFKVLFNDKLWFREVKQLV